MESSLASATTARRPAPALAVIAARSAATPASAAKPAASGETGDDGFGFRDVLSILNPLQYLPVVGSIYRAVTGDTIPETVRDIGSLAFSAVTGGPIGVAISAAVTAAEKLLDINPDQLAGKVLASLGIIDAAPEPQLAAAATAAGPAAGSRLAPWNRAHRTAYGAATLRSSLPAPARRADIAAAAGVSAASEAAKLRAAAAAYTRRTLGGIEPVIREHIIGHSA